MMNRGGKGEEEAREKETDKQRKIDWSTYASTGQGQYPPITYRLAPKQGARDRTRR